ALLSLCCSGDQGSLRPDMTGGPADGSDGEEAERCPICLGALAGGELAMPDSCCHVFCLGCLLTWAEVSYLAQSDGSP
uniref:RING-type domain-containing protein n=1 Tax=Oryzias sinensis TaxID=183150 RepID=A0A8C8A0W9_9TELE